MRDTYPTPAEINAITKRVQALTFDGQSFLLFGLVGRLLVANPEGLIDDLESAEQLDSEMTSF